MYAIFYVSPSVGDEFHFPVMTTEDLLMRVLDLVEAQEDFSIQFYPRKSSELQTNSYNQHGCNYFAKVRNTPLS